MSKWWDPNKLWLKTNEKIVESICFAALVDMHSTYTVLHTAFTADEHKDIWLTYHCSTMPLDLTKRKVGLCMPFLGVSFLLYLFFSFLQKIVFCTTHELWRNNNMTLQYFFKKKKEYKAGGCHRTSTHIHTLTSANILIQHRRQQTLAHLSHEQRHLLVLLECRLQRRYLLAHAQMRLLLVSDELQLSIKRG